MAVSRGLSRGGCVSVGGHAEADGLGPAGEGELDLGELVVGGGEADLQLQLRIITGRPDVLLDAASGAS
jgi:hypothetical protein